MNVSGFILDIAKITRILQIFPCPAKITERKNSVKIKCE